ncbi:META domain-containing protein [Chthonobacter rhizosphaerae]|uniref:META domain-containing protein n=1 Tax=Chthonobacter rhizosphaerae TaxID=2735553 RepID=UPI0015EE7D80|nr:META domain-containing protein [Chthonobacter rhizosphaerae]
MTRTLILSAAVLAAALVEGASPVPAAPVATFTVATFTGATFTVATVRGAQVPAGMVIRVTLGADRISGTTGCNSFGAGATLANGAIGWTMPLSATQARCADDAMAAAEASFLDALSASVAYVLTADTVTLTDAAGAETVAGRRDP